MEISEGLHVVDGVTFLGGLPLNVAAIIEPNGNIHLVDSGIPSSSTQILSYLEDNGQDPMNIKTLVLTHLDIDHAGAAAEIKQDTGCQIIASDFEARVISGEKFSLDDLKGLLPNYEQTEIESLHQKISEQVYPAVDVDRTVTGGDILDLGYYGEGQFYEVPGHSPGHIALFIPKLSVFIAGDAVSVSGQIVTRPKGEFTPSMRLALDSIKKLKDLEFDILIAYHGPPIVGNGSGSLRTLIESIE